MLKGPSSIEELQAVSGLAQSTVRLWLRALRDAGVVRLAAVDGPFARKCIYALNPDGLKDFRKPPKQPGATRTATWRKRVQVKALTKALRPDL